MNKKVVVQILRAPIGGIRKHVYDILTCLPADKFEHIFITDLSEADYPAPEQTNLRVFNLSISEGPALNDFLNIIRICRLLYGKNVDVVHGHGAKGGLYARAVSFLLRAKCFYTPHGGSLHRVHGKLKNFLYDLIELFMIPFTDNFLFESGYSRDIFFMNILNVGSKSIVNYNGVDMPQEVAEHVYHKGQKLRLASFGLLRHLKGHDIFLKTCGMLKREGIPFEYSIYGRGEEYGNLTRLISENGLQAEVKIHDYSGNVYLEMLKYDFIIHPSRFESFGYVPAEAMAVKVPVLASAEGGLKEVIDESCGYIASTNSPEEYFQILRNLYVESSPIELKVQNAYQKVRHTFSRTVMMETIEQLYCS